MCWSRYQRFGAWFGVNLDSGNVDRADFYTELGKIVPFALTGAQRRAIDERVMGLREQRPAAALEAFDQPRLPERARAIERQLIRVGCEDPRAHTRDVHRTVDDRPYGGGPGMVMMAEPVGKAMAATKGKANPAQVNELLKRKLGT